MTHNNLFNNYADLIKNLEKSQVNSPVLRAISAMISKPILRQQIKFISSMSPQIIKAINNSQKQQILSTDIYKDSQELIMFFRETYGLIISDDEYLNCFKDELEENFFKIFKDSIIDSLNQTLIKLELYFDLGKEPALKFFKIMQIFDPHKVKFTVNSEYESFKELVYIPEIENIMEAGNITTKAKLSSEFKSYIEFAKDYQKPDDLKTNVYIARFWMSQMENWKLLAPIVYKYIFVPISSADVERSFSCFNNILSDKRQSLTEESLKHLTALYFNSK
jgi:hypothetical protein